MDLNQAQVKELLGDLSYLEHEAEALKYVIDTIPYTETPPTGRSVQDTLLFLDHLQHNYYRQIIEESFKSVRPINLNSYTKPEDSFEPELEDGEGIQDVLFKIGKHRAGMLNLLQSFGIIDWEREITVGRHSITVYELAREMIRKERGVLKEIADLILTFQQNKNVGRESGGG
ncbi:MAG: hypothetical protein AAFW89_11830 [Bacteroidota bacterium]